MADVAHCCRRGLGNVAGNGVDSDSWLAAMGLGVVRCSRLAVRPWGQQRKLLATVVPHRVIPMKRTRFLGTGFAVTDRVVTNQELSELMDTTDEWIRTRTG